MPGIAPNLLAQRLRELEEAGVLYAEQAPPPVATTLYRLTALGAALEPVIKEIGSWARPLLEETDERDAFQSHWAVLPLRFYLEDTQPEGPPVKVQLESDDEPLVVEADRGSVDARVGRTESPDLVLSGPAQPTARLMMGRIGVAEARRQGVSCRGDVGLLERLRIPPPVGAQAQP
jgi:hypothetical protein